MIALFAALTVSSAVLILPGWIIARREKPQGSVLLFIALPGIVLWTVLTAAGIGAQSLANIVETFVIAVVSVIAAYAKFFIMDRREIKHGGLTALGIVLLVTLLLRIFMPLIPE